MQYTLLISLIFQKYKNDTKIRISLDDNFLDEVILDETTATKEVVLSPGQKWWSSINQNTTRITLPKKMLLYTINDEMIGKTIKITMQDTNTNYTNGFMTKSNLLKIQHCVLFPSCLLTKKNLTRLVHKWERTKSWCYDDGDIKTNSLMKDTGVVWWPGTRYLIDTEDEIKRSDTWVGGKQTLNFPVFKKFGVHMLDNPLAKKRQKKFGFDIEFIYYAHVFGLLNTEK